MMSHDCERQARGAGRRVGLVARRRPHLLRDEDVRRGREVVVAEPAVLRRPRCVDRQVERPAEDEEARDGAEEGEEGLRAGRRAVGARRRDEDRVVLHRVRRRVVLPVRDAPRVVLRERRGREGGVPPGRASAAPPPQHHSHGDEQRRVQHPADGVVDRLARAEGLVPALVCNHPHARERHARADPVRGPSKGEERGGDAGEGAHKPHGSEEQADHNKVARKVCARGERAALEAVRGDGCANVADGEGQRHAGRRRRRGTRDSLRRFSGGAWLLGG